MRHKPHHKLLKELSGNKQASFARGPLVLIQECVIHPSGTEESRVKT